MPDILLTTFNARFNHAAFGPRYLLANMGELAKRTELVEFDIHRDPGEAAALLTAQRPKIIGIGTYVWNLPVVSRLVDILKQQEPGITIILGGPEVSFATDLPPVAERVDYVIMGEADLKFTEVCGQLLGGSRPTGRIIATEPVELDRLQLPYRLYTQKDLAHRHLYVEASRGCPYRCEYCLSSLDRNIRFFPIPAILKALDELLDRGARQFKFVDRTFNGNIGRCEQILAFFLEKNIPGLFLHFEMVPDRFSESLFHLIRKFPPAVLQFEIGVQTFNTEVSERVGRRQDMDEVERNLKALREESGVHLHADLIAGLPGESLESFARGFDRLVKLHPHEIQVGILKRLRGAPIWRHDAEWQMVYGKEPPYEILHNRLLDAGTVWRIRRFARYWNLVANSGNFVTTLPLLLGAGESAFHVFMEFSDWLYDRERRMHGIALKHLADPVYDFLVEEKKCEPNRTAETIWNDYRQGGRTDKPRFARELQGNPIQGSDPALSKTGLKRHLRHLRG